MPSDQETLARLAGGELQQLLRLLEGTDIEELELEVGGTRLHFRRVTGSGLLGPRVAEPESDPLSAQDTTFVVAERVGFFHYSGEGPPGVLAPGIEVAAGQVLGVIDSLSVPIPVQAPCAGSLDEVLVEEGQAVEFGQPLFVIRPGDE